MEKEWIHELQWNTIFIPFDKAQRTRNEVTGFIKKEKFKAEGHVPYIVLNEKRELVDWFSAEKFPKRLQRGLVCVVGKTISDEGTLDLYINRLTVGVGHYSFKDYGDVVYGKPVEIVFKEGTPFLFKIWVKKALSIEVSAEQVLEYEEMQHSCGYNGVGNNQIEMVTVDNTAGEESVTDSIAFHELMAIIKDIYGKKADAVIAALVSYSELKNVGYTDEDAYAEIETEMDFEDGFMSSVRKAVQEFFAEGNESTENYSEKKRRRVAQFKDSAVYNVLAAFLEKEDTEVKERIEKKVYRIVAAKRDVVPLLVDLIEQQSLQDVHQTAALLSTALVFDEQFIARMDVSSQRITEVRRLIDKQNVASFNRLFVYVGRNTTVERENRYRVLISRCLNIDSDTIEFVRRFSRDGARLLVDITERTADYDGCVVFENNSRSSFDSTMRRALDEWWSVKRMNKISGCFWSSS